MKRSLEAVLCVVLACLGSAGAARGATFNVTTHADVSDPTPDGTCDSCSLREAIQEANALAGPDVINLPPGTYSMDIAGSDEDLGMTGDLDITDDVTIIGIGTTGIESHVGRIIHVLGGNVSITGLVLTQGDANNDPASGRAGGAIHNAAGSTLTLNQCTMTINQAQGGGGAIFNAGTLSLNDSTLTVNSAVGSSRGGAVYNVGTMTVTNCTLNGNSSTNGGGAVFVASAGVLNLNNVTLTDNASSGGVGGGGIKVEPGGTVHIANSIIANNNASGANDDCEGALTSLGSNLVEDSDGCTGLVAGDVTDVDPSLGPLQNNGGRTLTRAPLPGSPVLDTGGAAAACEARDQRGLVRPQGPACEEGAYEQFPSCPVLTLGPASLADGQDGVFYAQTIAPVGGVPPYRFSVTAGSLPDGLALDAVSGILSGVPTVSGGSGFTVTAFDANFCPGSLAYSLNLAGGPSCSPTDISLAPTQLPPATPGIAYAQTLVATGGAPPHLYTVTDGSLPPSLGLDVNTGTISGTPTVSGTFVFTATATDANTCTGNQGYALQVACLFTFAPASLASAPVGAPYMQALTIAAGGTQPYAFAVVSGALPPGFSLSGTGVLSGTPTAPGTYTFLVEATDANFCTGKIGYILVIDPCLVIAPTSVTNGVVGTAYSATLAATGGSGSATFSISAGALPPDLTLDPTGALAGTPTTPGTYLFTATATDGSCSVSRDYFLIVNPAGCPGITITPATLPGDTLGNNYNQNLTGSGGAPPYSFAVVSGTLPAGIDPGANGHLSGVSLVSGLFNFTMAAVDSNGCAGTQTYAILIVPSVCPALTLFPPVLPDGARGLAYEQTVLAAGGIPPYTYALTGGSLPPGLVFDPASRTISGTPTTLGDSTFTITVTDLAGCTGTVDYTMHISPDLRGANCALFGDTFEDDLLSQGWTYFKPTWSESGGNMIGSSGKKALAAATPGFAGCVNCAVETSMMTSHANDGKIALLGWFVDKKNFMELSATAKSNVWMLKQRVKGTIVAKVKAIKTIDANVPYTVKLVFDGVKFDVFVDDLDTPLMSLTPKGTVPAGTVGLQATATTGTFAYVCVK